MEVFFSRDVCDGIVRLDAEESCHCVRVLRHREGDEVCIIDGEGTLNRCILVDACPKEAVARVVSSEHGWGSHPYRLTMAVCPTKNNERFEWFVEKATEIGVDVIVPVIGDRSERRVIKTERLCKIALSAAKQSLKGDVPEIASPVSVKEFVSASSQDALKLIAYCDNSMGDRQSVMDALEKSSVREISVLIGPEGDFSQEEVNLALSRGFVPVHFGESRLRTETAALTAVEAVYLQCI